MLELVVNDVISTIFLVDGVGVCFLFKSVAVAGNQFFIVSGAINDKVIVSKWDELYLLVNSSAANR